MRPGLRSQPGQARPEFSLVTNDGWLSCQDLSFISHRFQFHLCVCHLRNQKNGVLEVNCLDANGSFPKIKQLVGNTSADTHCCALGERSGAALLALPALAPSGPGGCSAGPGAGPALSLVQAPGPGLAGAAWLLVS